VAVVGISTLARALSVPYPIVLVLGRNRFAAQAGSIEDDGYEDQTLAYQQTLQHLLGAQRETLLRRAAATTTRRIG